MFGVSPYNPWMCEGSAHCLVGGSPPFLHLLSEHWGSALTGPGVPPYSLPARGKSVLTCGGSPPPSSISWLRDGVARGLVGMSPSLPWLRAGSAHCWLRGSHPPPPNVSARVKHALLLRDYSLHVSVLWLAARKERALLVMVHRLCRPLV